MGMTVRPEKFGGIVPLAVNRDANAPKLRALTSFVDTAVPALLLLTLMAGEQSETAPDLKRLASILSELQDGTGAERSDGPDPTAIGRLYRAVMSLKACKNDH